MKKTNILLLLLVATSFFPANAQVMWNMKGGIMQRSFYSFNHDDHDKRIDWMAGMELEIPLSRRLNLETGLRYKNHYVFSEDNKWMEEETTNLFELPLRLTYKQPLGNHFMLHAGMGPYLSYVGGEHCGDGFNKNIHVGLEPSVVINWACLSLGASYNIPCFYKGYKDKNDPAIMATLGIRFKSHVWKYVGATLLTIATAGAAAGYAWEAANSGSSYSSSSYSSGGYYSSGSNYGSSSSSVGQSCKFCAGSGKCSGKNRCRGDGQCKFCYGQGYQSTNGHYHECGVCHGTKKCSFCGGTGKCKHCGGTGKR